MSNAILALWECYNIHETHHSNYDLIMTSCVLERIFGNTTPSKNEILFYWYNLLYLKCACLHVFNTGDILSSMEHIAGINVDMDCESIILVHEYYVQESTYPTCEQLEAYIQRIALLQTDVERYCVDHEEKTPVQNLHLLQPEPCNGPSFCCICQEDIPATTSVYTLPCGHVYHSNTDHCLGEGQVY